VTVYPGPDTGPITLIASMDDELGLTVGVSRDHDGVCISAGGVLIMLSADGAHALRAALGEAITEAILWGLTNE
jgi:hypothetical protein